MLGTLTTHRNPTLYEVDTLHLLKHRGHANLLRPNGNAHLRLRGDAAASHRGAVNTGKLPSCSRRRWLEVLQLRQ